MSKLRVRFAVVLLVLISALGLHGAAGEWRGAETPGQITATITQLLYGVCGIVAALALMLRWRAAKPLVCAWAVALTITGGLAPVVWGGALLLWGVASALTAAAICVAVVALVFPRTHAVT